MTPKDCRQFYRNGKFSKYVLYRAIEITSNQYMYLTRKGRQFIWGREQQDAFKEIKQRLVKPPILHMPHHEGRFHLIFRHE